MHLLLTILIILFAFTTTVTANEYRCETELQQGDEFKCNVIKAYKFKEDTKIKSFVETVNGKIGKVNDDTLTFVPNSGFSGKQEITFTVVGEAVDKTETLTLTYSSLKQNLLAPGQIAAIGTLLLLVLALAIVLEFALRHIFQWRWFIILFEGRGIKFIVSLGIAMMLVLAVDIDLVAGFSSIISNNVKESTALGRALTALIISGGSATVVQIWKMFNFLPDPGVAETAVKKRNFSRIKCIVDRELLDNTQKAEPLEVYIDGDLVGAIEPGANQYPPVNFLWSGHPVEAKEHTYEVVYATGSSHEMRWQRRHGVPHLNIKSTVLHFKLDPNEVVFVKSSDMLMLSAPTALKRGDPFKVGSIIAIATTDTESGTIVKALTTGVFEVPKAFGVAFAQGDILYWDDTDRKFTKTATDNTLAGVAVAAAASNATVAHVRLSG